MTIEIKSVFLSFAVLAIATASTTQAQQKGQYVPGQFGLNAGVVPSPGFTYGNLALNYSASHINDANGNHLPNVSGSYAVWADENIIYYVSNFKILGARYAPYISINPVTGSLVADITGTNLSGAVGGSGLGDTWFQPVNLAWGLNHADITLGYAFVAPTGRFTPKATDNVGSGYWGNNLTAGATYYITKNKGTTANLFTDWEGHSQKTGTNLTPGQAFTIEWGVGQVLPLKKNFSQLLQVGLIGYDQWQVSASGGTNGPVPANLIPFYSVHAIGFQANYIVPAKNLNFFFKYADEYRALARPEGRTIAFGGTWTLRVPKPVPPAPLPAP